MHWQQVSVSVTQTNALERKRIDGSRSVNSKLSRPHRMTFLQFRNNMHLHIFALALAACSPELSVGTWTCPAAAMVAETDPVGVPWSTGFEDQFCDYTQLAGFCYAEDNASYTTVTSPVHSGRFAAAFSVVAGDSNGHQTRCVRQGVLPTAAYYGAWYFIPTSSTNTALWNLVHFQGGDPSAGAHGLWDVSLVNGTTGDLELVVYDFLNGATRRPSRSVPVPIGAWFHIELYLVRATDATGEVALYQDDQQLFDVKNVRTDDSSWAQWYVGNLATGLSPRDSTLYVDDVSIRSAR
jgi:hypothetical protein